MLCSAVRVSVVMTTRLCNINLHVIYALGLNKTKVNPIQKVSYIKFTFASWTRITFSTCAIEHRPFRVTYAVVMARVAQTPNVVNCNNKVALIY